MHADQAGAAERRNNRRTKMIKTPKVQLIVIDGVSVSSTTES